MVKNNQYTKLQEVLSRILRHPMLQDVTMEAAVQYTIDFIHIFGFPNMYETKEAAITISQYRGQLPCDLISINQVKEKCSGICLRSMTDTFFPTKNTDYIKRQFTKYSDLTYKTQNQVIFTSFENGEVLVNYNAVPVDENGFPLIIDNPVYLKTLELYIKLEVFTIKYDEGKIPDRVLQNTQQQYAWKAGQLQSEFNIPSESEMESICNSWTTLIQRTNDFENGWKYLGKKEHLRVH